ncbi:MAG: hypothetical protein QMD92_03495 [bacterium]|nr:hypothetical protein [bacterium]
MDTTNINQTCPLCEKDKHMEKKAKLLYGYLVCKKCYYSFANRRQVAFAVDIILYIICKNICQGIVLKLAASNEADVDMIRGLSFLSSFHS